MLTKLILLFLMIGQILASSSYIEDGKRAELFEITDNEVPIFRVTISDENFKTLKNAMQNIRLSFRDVYEGKYSEVAEFEKVKDAKMVVEINGTKKEFNKVNFDIGGSSARTYGRQAFNIKIRIKRRIYMIVLNLDFVQILVILPI